MALAVGCRLALDRLLALVRLLGQLARRRRQRPQPAASACLAKSGEHRGRPLPVRDRRVGRAELVAADPVLDPVRDRLRDARPGAHERQQILRGALGCARASQRGETSADGGMRQRNPRLDRDGDPESVENLRVEEAVGLGMAEHDRDVVGCHAAGEQARDLSPDRLRLAPLAGALQKRDPVVRSDPRRPGLEQDLVELAKRGAFGVLAVEGKLAFHGPVQLVTQSGHQPGPGRERFTILVVDGDRDLAGARERCQQLQLLLRQVVEAVDQHRPVAPGGGPVAQAGRNAARGGVRVVSFRRHPPLHVRCVKARQLLLMAAAFELGGGAGKLIGFHQRRLELADQPLEHGREPWPRGGAAQQRQLGVTNRIADQGEPLCRGQEGTNPRAGRGSDLVDQVAKGPDRGPNHGATLPAQLPLEPVGVVERGNHQDRIAVQRGLEARADLPGAAGVRRPDYQGEGHRSQHRSLHGAGS